MASIYLQCSKCDNTFAGLVHNKNNLNWSQVNILQEEARLIGWSGDLSRQSENDLCPECNKQIGEQR